MTPAILLAVFTLSAAPTTTTDWPQWRGPHRDGKSAETGIVIPKEGPKLLWQKDDIGIGYGQPAVVADRMYIIGGADNKPGSAEWVRCMTVADGTKIWQTELGTSPGGFNAGWGGGPRSTPTVDRDFIYAAGATGDIVCLNAADGTKVWSKNLVKDFGGKIPSWGYSESPLVDDGHVIITPGSGTAMVALEAKTGKTVWECKEVNDGAGYSSIIPMMVGSVKVYVQQNMKAFLGVRANDGKMLFHTGEIGRRTAVIPTPVVAGEYVFLTAGYGAGCECYKLAADGDGVKAEKVYSKYKTVQNHTGGVIGVGDYVYGHSDSGAWTCFAIKSEKDSAVWQSDKLRGGKGSITFADGHLICYAESGEVAVIDAKPDGWNETARFKIPKTSAARGKTDGKVWAHPVVAQGKLFLRDFDLLFAYDVKGK